MMMMMMMAPATTAATLALGFAGGPVLLSSAGAV
jgi:hypothetical protein